MAAIGSCLGSKSLNPADLNPYRQKSKPDTYGVDEIERSHSAHVKAGRHIVQTISASQVIQ